MAIAKIDIWMPIYIGDYLRDTQALTAEEHGVYFLLLMHYWQKKGDIGSDIKRLSIVARSDTETTQNILDSFFVLENGKYRNKRADEELTAAKSRSDAAKANINKRWNKTGNTPVIPPYNDGSTDDNTKSIPIEYSSPSSSSSQERQEEKKDSIGRFKKPTFEEVREYCMSRDNRIDAQAFIDHYESNGWSVGKNKMKDWRAAVRTWENNDIARNKPALKIASRTSFLDMEE